MSFSCGRIQIHTRLLEKYHKGRFNARICSCAAHYFGIFCLTAAVLFNLQSRAGDGASAASLKACYFFLYFSLIRGSLKKKKIGCRSRRTTPVCFFFFFSVIQIVFHSHLRSLGDLFIQRAQKWINYPSS